MSEAPNSPKEPRTPRDYLKDFLRAQMIVEHVRKVRTWPRYGQWIHRLLVGWRCPACKAFKRNEHEGWGLKV